MADALFCFCGKPYDNTQFMIQCDYCKDWFHGSCINLKEYQACDIDKFFCSKCEPSSGPTVRKPVLNLHRHDYSDPDASQKATQAGTQIFIRDLKARSFLNAEEVILRLRGQQLTLPYLNGSGFTRPIFVEHKDGLDLNVPQDSFTVEDVENYIGSDRIIDVIDVTKQSDIRMALKDFVEYYTNPLRSQVLNVISLEFSDSNLSALVEPPYIARKLCWANNVWPRDYALERPEVQKYCLMGVKDSYTDFHIDFGGSSVWYHVLKGEKVFYLVAPTEENLDFYLQWLSKPNHHEIFFGDMVSSCHRFVLHQGNTLFIPTGWIHAVYTPKDSLVFGGNFLHNLNMELQLKVYNIEVASKAPIRFRFPMFQTIHWFAAERLVEDLRDMSRKGSRCPEQLIRGVRALATALRNWTLEKDQNGKGKNEPIPEHIIVSKLLKELSRELRHVEKNSNSSLSPFSLATSLPNVPNAKVEKNSPKRVRRKPQTRPDFVDINEALSNFAAEEDLLSIKVERTDEPRTIPFLPPTLRVSSLPYAVIHSRPSAVPLKHVLPKRGNDEEEEQPLMIDERKGHKPAKIGPNMQRGPIKLRLSVGGRTDVPFPETAEVAAHMDIETGEDKQAGDNKSGIEELLRASNMAVPGALDELEDRGRASPSTREAIVGMLTMSRGFSSPTSDQNGFLNSNPPPHPSASQRQRKGRRRLNSSLTDDYDDVKVSKVHQDEEYIYPSLDASDDERDGKDSTKKRSGKVGRSRLDSGDESWNPRARVGPVVPKKDRPTRDGAKRPAVERVLEAAAQRRALEPPPKRAYVRRSKSRSISDSPQTEAGVSDPIVQLSVAAPTAPTIPPPTPPLGKAESKVNLAKKPKKGMATAKQRLGKILKIHKMVH
ncbi:lysine-specific demethylase 7B isoform X1 [Daphnia magna]|uniref:lysine-specific demethylase 7B isoform X1 n=1 Tax=Daphnia magna TaxID=35525 RepID=UPI001E1BCCCD|nr:lysine-specific demethylase 7B isoform X1 [Daphnia magna]